MTPEPTEFGTVTFERSWVRWEPGSARICFHDGSSTCNEWGGMPPDQARWYADTAKTCGYDSVSAYALHHDVLHCWLPDRLWKIASPTLWAVAHNEPPPPINRSEEYLINTVQWTLATGNEFNAEYLRQIIGDDWKAVLEEARQVLRSLA